VFCGIVTAVVLIGFGHILQMDLIGRVISLGLVGVAIAFAAQQTVPTSLPAC